MQSEQINELAAALAKAQGAFEDVVKGKKAEVGKYSYTYADLATVLQAVRKPLSSNGLALAQVTHSENGSFWLESCLLHDSGQYITATWPLPGQGTPQQIGSALTYARRYTASALLGIASEDDDGAAGGDVKPSTGAPPKVEQKEKPAFYRDEQKAASEAAAGMIHVYDAAGNYSSFPRTQKGAAQAIGYLEGVMREDPSVWQTNQTWAMEVHDRLGEMVDKSVGDKTKAGMTFAERISYLESVAEQEPNPLAAG